MVISLKVPTFSALGLVSLLALSGCLQAGAFRVDIATHYDPDYTRSRDEECGLEPGAVASEAEMEVVVFRRDNGSGATAAGGDDPNVDGGALRTASEHLRSRGAVLSLAEEADRAEFLFELDERGATMFHVDQDPNLWLTLRVVGGRTDDTGCCDRRYSGWSGQPVTFPLSDDEEVEVPFGITCADKDVE